MSLSKDFVEFVACLNARSVEYLLVGGYAVAFHGKPRFTKDIDFWIRASPANADRLMEALDDFDFGGLGLRREDFSVPGKVVQLGVPPNRIDLITSVDGVDFDAAWCRRVESDYGEVSLAVIHRDDLIRNKETTGRPQDLLDVDCLRGLDDNAEEP